MGQPQGVFSLALEVYKELFIHYRTEVKERRDSLNLSQCSAA